VKNCSPVDLELQRNDFISSIENVQDCEAREVNPANLQAVAQKWEVARPRETLSAKKRQFIVESVKLNVPEQYQQHYLQILLQNHEAVSQDKFDLVRRDTLMHEIALKQKNRFTNSLRFWMPTEKKSNGTSQNGSSSESFSRPAEGNYPPIPIVYQLENSKASVTKEYYVAPKNEALIKVKVSKDTQMTGQKVMLTPLCNELEITPFKDTVTVFDDEGNALMMVANTSEDILKVPNYAQVATITSVYEKKGLWAKEALQGKLKELLPPHIKIRNKKLLSTRESDDEIPEENIKYIHDKGERKDLLDGTGEGLPAPTAAESIKEGEPEKPEDPDQWLNSVEHSHLSEGEWKKLKQLLLKRKEAFSKTKTEVGCCRYFKLDLPLKPGTGYLHNKPRHVPFKYREIAQKAIDDLLEQRIIRPSRSPHSTNLVVVKKKTMNGVVAHRICVDLRQVNQHTIPNSFPNY
jgi:hypothetical protein